MDPGIRPSSTPRKVRFQPRAPPRRETKPPQARREAVQEVDTGDGDEKRAKYLTSGQPKAEKKSYGILENDKDPLSKKKKRGYKKPWDYDHSYYPTSLPWRNPFSGDPEELLDKDKFGAASSASEYDDTVNSASDLGLLEKVDEAKMLFFQLPFGSTQGMSPVSDSSQRGNASNKGRLGKLLVYKSGVVKLNLGDILFDVSPGCDCNLAQEIVAINKNRQQCCTLGEPNKKWAIVTPDV